MTHLEIIVPVVTFLLGSVLASISKGMIKGAVDFLRNRFFTRDRWIREPRDDIKVVEWEELGGAWRFRGQAATGWKLLVENKGRHHIIITRCQFTGAVYTKRTLALQAKRVYWKMRQMWHIRYTVQDLRYRIYDLRSRRPNRNHSGLLSTYSTPSGKSVPRISTATVKNIYLPPKSSMTLDVCFGPSLTSFISTGEEPRSGRFTISLTDWGVKAEPSSDQYWEADQISVSGL